MTPELAYLIGFFWADGSISNENGYIIELVAVDCAEVSKVIDRISVPYKTYSRSRANRQPQQSIRITDPLFTNELRKLGMSSYRDQAPLVELIPEEVRSYYYLGFSDGDGNFYYNKEYGLNQYTLSGRYNQDWNYLVKQLGELNIDSKIRRIQGPKSSYSALRFTGRERIRRWTQYLYPKDYEFGLKRKYLAAQTISLGRY